MITFYSIIWTLINCILMAFIIFILRTRTSFAAKHGTTVLNFLIICCIIRILFPIEFPNHQFVIADSHIYSKLFQPINKLLFPEFPDWFFPFLICIWISGSIFHIIRLYRKTAKVRHILRDNICETDERTLDILKSIDSNCPIPVHSCSGISVPVLAGYLHPTIYIPDYTYSKRELYYIVLHEYMHWKRKDLWKKLLVHIICVVFWWNPAVYIIRKEVAQLFEFNCDKRLTKSLDEIQLVHYLDTLLLSFAQAQIFDIKTNIYTIEFVNSSKKYAIYQRFDLLLNRNRAIRKRTFPKVLIILLGLLWLYCSYYFILQTKYVTPEYSLLNGDTKSQSVIHIADEDNSYLVEQADGSYIFYFNDFFMEVPKEDIEAGLYEFYPIIEYKDPNIFSAFISKIQEWLHFHLS